METSIGIKSNTQKATVQTLSVILADEFVLYTKTLNAHWNVEDANFYSLHKLFEEQYNKLQEVIDDTAERIRSLGHFAPATLKDFTSLTHLSEQNRDRNDGAGFIKALLLDHQTIIVHLRESLIPDNHDSLDAGTNDFITGLI